MNMTSRFPFGVDRPARRTLPQALFAALFCLSGCSDMAGLGGTSKYACKAPSGVHCDSVTATYANGRAGNLPSQQMARARQNALAGQAGMPAGPRPAGVAAIPNLGGALRSDGRVLRLWIKPWEDSDHDLVDQSYVYLQVERARWQLEHVQRLAREPYAPLVGPADSAAPAASKAEPAPAPTTTGTPATSSAPDIGIETPPAGTEAPTDLPTVATPKE